MRAGRAGRWMATLLGMCLGTHAVFAAACGGGAKRLQSTTARADATPQDTATLSSPLARALLAPEDSLADWTHTIESCEVDPTLPPWQTCVQVTLASPSGETIVEEIATFGPNAAEALMSRVQQQFADAVAWQIVSLPRLGDEAIAARSRVNVSFDEQALVRHGDIVLTLLYHAPSASPDSKKDPGAAETFIRAADAKVARYLTPSATQ